MFKVFSNEASNGRATSQRWSWWTASPKAARCVDAWSAQPPIFLGELAEPILDEPKTNKLRTFDHQNIPKHSKKSLICFTKTSTSYNSYICFLELAWVDVAHWWPGRKSLALSLWSLQTAWNTETPGSSNTVKKERQSDRFAGRCPSLDDLSLGISRFWWGLLWITFFWMIC